MSDLREALKRIVSLEEQQPGLKALVSEMRATAKEALSAQPQPEAVEATQSQIQSACLSYRHDYGLLPPDLRTRTRIEAVEWLRAWQKEGFCTAPPVAPDERVRRALAEALADNEALRSANTKLVLAERDRLEALSRADDGKESEGGQLPKGLQRAIDDTRAAMDVALSKLPKLKATSDPTPAEQREAVERIVRDQLLQLDLGCGENVNIHDAIAHLRGDADVGHAVELIEDVSAWIADAILALSTRAGG